MLVGSEESRSLSLHEQIDLHITGLQTLAIRFSGRNYFVITMHSTRECQTCEYWGSILFYFSTSTEEQQFKCAIPFGATRGIISSPLVTPKS